MKTRMCWVRVLCWTLIAVVDVERGGRAQSGPHELVRGDSNGDSSVDVSDAVHVLVRLFVGGGDFPCADASDANDDGVLNVTDAVRILGLLFQGGPPLPEPLSCGLDPTDDALECSDYAACDTETIASLSDTFEGTELDPAWSVLRPNLVQVGVAGGALSLRASSHSLWYQASRGPLVHKLVTGDFRVTARVHARRSTDESLAPSQNIHLGGLMARDPASEPSGVENYVFIVVGQDENDPSVETKTTDDSQSTYQGPSWLEPDAELRICRLGSTLRLYKRPVGAVTWTLAATFNRPDLPETLQVGPFIYAASNAPDLIVRFDEVVFADASVVGDCTE